MNKNQKYNNYNAKIRNTFTDEEREELLKNILYPDAPTEAYTTMLETINKIKNNEYVSRDEAIRVYTQIINITDISINLSTCLIDYSDDLIKIGRDVVKIIYNEKM